MKVMYIMHEGKEMIAFEITSGKKHPFDINFCDLIAVSKVETKGVSIYNHTYTPHFTYHLTVKNADFSQSAVRIPEKSYNLILRKMADKILETMDLSFLSISIKKHFFQNDPDLI